MTTAHELAAYGLPSEAEVGAMRRRLTAPERGTNLWGRPDPSAARIPLDDLPGPSSMTEAARLYCVEETWRQGYSLHTPDGRDAAGRMIGAWADAAERPEVTPEAVERIGRAIEPDKNPDGFRRGAVYVGGSARLQSVGMIRRGIDLLCREAPKPGEAGGLEALIWYWRFETVHPFNDGNGRTGKILLNTLLGRMADPVFPPHDLWGRPIRNP